MALSPHARRHGLHGLTAAGIAIVLTGVVWLGGLIAFAATIPSTVDDLTSNTDAIVVLTGGTGRLEEGLDLLAKKRAKKLFVSGVYQGVDVQRLLEISRHRPDELSCCIALGYAANSTTGNAVETAAWLKQENYTSIRLVTASYHMPRSLIEFHHQMPDIRIVSNPVFPPQFKHATWWEWPGTAQLILAEYTKFLAAGARHLLEDLLN